MERTNTIKRILLARLIELFIKHKVDIVPLIGMPLNKFDWGKIERIIEDSVLDWTNWEVEYFNIKYIIK